MREYRQGRNHMSVAIQQSLPSQSRVDRESIRSDLEATRIAFHELLDSIPDEGWRQKVPGGGWTSVEVLVHLTWALEQLPREIESARRGKGMFNYPRGLRDPLSYWYTRWIARNATRDSISRRYDAAMGAVLRALDEVPDTDWSLGAPFYGEGFYTVEGLLRGPSEHLKEHAAASRAWSVRD
jgi:hypothetical protein